MPRDRRLRRRPSTPNLNQHQSFFTADPASPPETPAASPQFSRKTSLKPRHQDDPYFGVSASLANDPNIKPFGSGRPHQFSYRPNLGPEQLSPRSSASSSIDLDNSAESSEHGSSGNLPNAPEAPEAPEAPGASDVPFFAQSRYQAFLTRQSPSTDSDADGEEDDENDDSGDDFATDKDDAADGDGRKKTHPSIAADFPPEAAAAFWEFVLEDMDPMEQALDDALDTLYPYEIESARSRSSSWHKTSRDLDRSVMRGLRDLRCSNETSDDDDLDIDPSQEVFLKRQTEMRRLRRVSMSSSVGKRTHSELSDSEDDFGPLDVNDAGSSARRLRKRLHRGSLLFHDPPEQIEELDEPNSSEDERQAGKSLAQELPYWTLEKWTMEIIEMETS